MSFVELMREDRRLSILEFLSRAPGGQLNISVMQSVLKSLGHRMARSDLTDEAAWLEERGLLAREFDGAVQLLNLTERGADVAEGTLTVEGIRRPKFRG